MAVVRRSTRIPPQAAMLPGGRLHLQHGPIDLIALAEGEPAAVQVAYAALVDRFATLLEELCDELPTLRSAAHPSRSVVSGAVARRMEAAVQPLATATFITPMAAVAGAVSDEALATLCGAAPLRRASVNNGGDIALYLAPGQSVTIGLVDRPDRPSLFATSLIAHCDGVGGVATSGWRGRSFSLGIADAVTVCAATAAQADAAATVIANAVDLPGHPAIHRVAASALQPDSDLRDRLVTRGVDPLMPGAITHALDAGIAQANALIRSRLIAAAALHCQGITRIAARPASIVTIEVGDSRNHQSPGTQA